MQCACAVLYCLSVCLSVCLYHIFPHYVKKGTIFGKKKLSVTKCFWFPVKLSSETFPTLSSTERHTSMIPNVQYTALHAKHLSFLSDFNENSFLDRFSKHTLIPNLKKIHPSWAQLFHADGQTDRQTDVMKLAVTYRNFANAPKTSISLVMTKQGNLRTKLSAMSALRMNVPLYIYI